MIQRKQSIWLLIAALLNAGVFYFALYNYHVTENGADVTKMLRVSDHYPSVLIALVMTILPLVTIFMFGNRKRQTGMTMVSIFATLSFITMALNRVTAIDKLTPPPTNSSYWIGAILPVIAIVFLVMAAIGIRRDEKLVKSVDRLR